jgi:hypothetical protein
MNFVVPSYVPEVRIAELHPFVTGEPIESSYSPFLTSSAMSSASISYVTELARSTAHERVVK